MNYVARVLATAFLAGRLDTDELVQRGAQVLGRRRRWLFWLARSISETFSAGPRPRHARLVRFICGHRPFRKVYNKSLYGMAIVPWTEKPIMCPAGPRAVHWEVPELTTPGALAAWCGIRPNRLYWLADCRGLERRVPAGPLRHYHYRWCAKPNGSGRLIEVPKQQLKALQRRLLHEILDRIPPHQAVHGFRLGRSVRTFVADHTARAAVLRMDLRDFFPSISASRVLSLFMTAGYPEPVARLLTGLCTNSVPAEVWETAPAQFLGPTRWHTRCLYETPHLPQGAPTSLAIANLCAYRLDCRLGGLARSVGAHYTRYADDLAFSGGRDFARCCRRFYIQVGALAIEEGFAVNMRKTRIMRSAVRQHIAGLVVNQHPNIKRPEYDRLKAILHNCVRYGLDTQNRGGHDNFRDHLAGRIAFVEMIHPERGRRLRLLFERIHWS